MLKAINTTFNRIFFTVLLLGLFSVVEIQDIFPQESSIPEWIKNNAGWWAEGQIDDSAFIQGIQFLVGQGIISLQSNTPHTEEPNINPEEPNINPETFGTSGNVIVQKDTGQKLTDTEDKDWYLWSLVIEDGSNTPLSVSTILSLKYTYSDGTISDRISVVTVEGIVKVRAQFGEQPNAESIIITDIDGYVYEEEFNLVIK